MAEMKFKENLGVDPVTLSQGYTKLDGDPPNSGENIINPEHRKRAEMMAEMYPGSEDEEYGGPTGFVEREKPSDFLRTMRTEDEDQG